MRALRLSALLVIPTFLFATAAPAFAYAASDVPAAATAHAQARTTVRTGTIASVSGSTISLTGESYTIDASTAIIVRRLGGKSSLGELSAGDHVRVLGAFNADKTVLTVKRLRDLSIEERNSLLIGKATSVDAAGGKLVLTTPAGVAFTVTLAADAKLVDRKGAAITLASVKIGDKIRLVGGLRNLVAKTQQGVERLRDLSLPAVAAKKS